MKSAGNDIVALRTVNKLRSNQSRFYLKILSASEQELYRQPQFAEMPFEHYVWLLWSVKESAYKYLKRTIVDLEFSPTRFVVQCVNIPARSLMTILEGNRWENTGYGEEFYSGKVTFGSQIFYYRSKISEDWISTVVNDEEHFENVYWGVQSIDGAAYDQQSKSARTIILNKLRSFFPGDLHIEKNPVGYPEILKGMENMHIPVSLAHDDHFVAYSFLLDCQSDGKQA